ncbi:unnamed protein product [Moneuplotes crassus]|uniref:Uncharacterized protein n=1 Tax=Euplotes crassus TaxID=5936 RepID=A0AAD1XN14_EUPCR|nr:unnamed protein product [Moneuplotes crassus]
MESTSRQIDIYKVRMLFHQAKQMEAESKWESAKNVYQEVLAYYKKLGLNSEKEDTSLTKMINSCEISLKLMQLKSELPPCPKIGDVPLNSVQIEEESKTDPQERKTDESLNIILNSLSRRPADGISAEAQNEFERIKHMLEHTNQRVKKLLNSLMEMYLKLEIIYTRDFVEVLDGNVYGYNNLFVKNMNKQMKEMKKYISKVIDSADTNLNKGRDILKSSLLSSTPDDYFSSKISQSSIMDPKRPINITEEDIENYLSDLNPPPYVKEEKYNSLKSKYKKLYKKYKEYKKSAESKDTEISQLHSIISQLQNDQANLPPTNIS